MSIILIIVLTMSGSYWNIHTMDDNIAQLIRTIDDDPDPLHSDETPSVRKLIEKGLPALPQVVTLMNYESKDTRIHAQRVLEGITMKQLGFEKGKGWTKKNGEIQWKELWNKFGNMQWNDTLEKRKKSIILWEAWIRDNKE